MIILNTIEQLETVYGIDKVNASRMIDIYNNRIGTIMGVNKITGITYMFNTSEPAIRYRINNMDMTLKQALETPKTTQGRPRKVVVYAEIHE